MAELLEGINTETCETQQGRLDITFLAANIEVCEIQQSSFVMTMPAANIEVCEILVSSFLCAIGVGLIADFDGRYYIVGGSKSRFIAPLGVRGGFR